MTSYARIVLLFGSFKDANAIYVQKEDFITLASMANPDKY